MLDLCPFLATGDILDDIEKFAKEKKDWYTTHTLGELECISVYTYMDKGQVQSNRKQFYEILNEQLRRMVKSVVDAEKAVLFASWSQYVAALSLIHI